MLSEASKKDYLFWFYFSGKSIFCKKKGYKDSNKQLSSSFKCLKKPCLRSYVISKRVKDPGDICNY